MRPSNILDNKTPSETYWKVQLVCIKFQAQSSLEPLLKYNQDQMPLMNQASSKVSRAKFLGNDELFYFISIYKFASFKNPFAMITSLAELYFRFRRFTLLVEI